MPLFVGSAVTPAVQFADIFVGIVRQRQKGGQLARRKSLNYALIFPENILLTLFFISMNTIFTSFRICENSYK